MMRKDNHHLETGRRPLDAPKFCPIDNWCTCQLAGPSITKKKKQAGGFDENVHLRKQTATPAPEFQQQPKAAKWNLIIQKKN